MKLELCFLLHSVSKKHHIGGNNCGSQTSNAFFIGRVFFRVNYGFATAEVEDGLKFMVLGG